MNDELEIRLRDAFRGSLPAAPASLLGALDDVPNAPLTRAVSGSRGRALAGRRGGLLAVAAVLLVGGAVAVSVGNRNPSPLPLTSMSPSPIATSAATSIATSTRLTYEPQWTAEVPSGVDVLAAAVAIVRQRMDAAGLAGIRAAADPDALIVVDLPAGIDPDAVRRLVGTTGRLEFVALGTFQMEVGDHLDLEAFPPLFDGSFVLTASVTTEQAGQPALLLTLREPATSVFRQYTAAHVGEFFALVVDGTVVASPMVQSEILDGEVQVTFGGPDTDPAEVAGLAAIIGSGPLPVALDEIGGETPGTTPSPAPESRVHCEAPLAVDGPQLTCGDAVQSALAILPGDHPAIADVVFNHDCHDVIVQAIPDCAIQLSGTVTVTFIDGSPPVRIAVSLGSSPRILANLPSPAASGPPLTLNLVPGDLGCDSIAPPYDSLVIHIDPSAADPVWAIADTGKRLRTFWAAGFHGDTRFEPVVLDEHGVVVARDGTRIDLPDAAWPDLGGHFVCPGPDAIYVFTEAAPA